MLECSSSLAGSTAVFSPSGEYFASLSGSRVIARSKGSMATSQIFQCLDKVDKFAFSPDSTMLMCALYTRNVVQVFSLEDKEWKCRINEGVAGLINAFWTPDSSSVVTESDFGIQMSIWSLTSGVSTIVSLPKPPSSPYSRTSAFSECGRFLAVVHRIEHHDQIGVCSVLPPMGEVSKFRAKSNEVASVRWVPDGTHLVTLDAPLVYRICVYTPMGQCVANFEAYQHALGIRCLGIFAGKQPTPTASAETGALGAVVADKCRFLALGSFDSKIRLLSLFSWAVAFVLPLCPPREMDAGFGCAHFRCTVEVVSGAAAAASAGGASRSAADTELLHTDPGDELVSLQQVQSPAHRQALRSRPLHTHGRKSVAVSSAPPPRSARPKMSSFNAQLADAMEAEAEGGGGNQDSIFVLRSVKTLPRLLGFESTNKKSAGAVALAGKNISRRPASSTSALSGTTGAGGFPAVGVSWLGWCGSGDLLAAREESYPRCLWVWRPLQATLVALLVQLEPISCAQWRPPLHPPLQGDTHDTPPSADGIASQNLPPAPGTPGDGTLAQPPDAPSLASGSSAPRARTVSVELPVGSEEEGDVLAFCTGTERVYFWTPSRGAIWCDLAEIGGAGSSGATSGERAEHLGGVGFGITSLQWSNDARFLILRGKESHCVCRVTIKPDK